MCKEYVKRRRSSRRGDPRGRPSILQSKMELPQAIRLCPLRGMRKLFQFSPGDRKGRPYAPCCAISIFLGRGYIPADQVTIRKMVNTVQPANPYHVIANQRARWCGDRRECLWYNPYLLCVSAFCEGRCHFLVAEQESNQRNRLKEGAELCNSRHKSHELRYGCHRQPLKFEFAARSTTLRKNPPRRALP